MPKLSSTFKKLMGDKKMMTIIALFVVVLSFLIYMTYGSANEEVCGCKYTKTESGDVPSSGTMPPPVVPPPVVVQPSAIEKLEYARRVPAMMMTKEGIQSASESYDFNSPALKYMLEAGGQLSRNPKEMFSSQFDMMRTQPAMKSIDTKAHENGSEYYHHTPKESDHNEYYGHSSNGGGEYYGHKQQHHKKKEGFINGYTHSEPVKFSASGSNEDASPFYGQIQL
jgi:hypothetical protein